MRDVQAFVARLKNIAMLLAAAGFAAPALAGQTVLVPNRVIYPGETVFASTLEQVELAEGYAAPTGMAIALADLDGKVAKRTLLPGRYVQLTALREAWLVEKGASIEMMVVAGNLTISATGVTLESGAAGDLIKVRNIDSGKVVAGTLMANRSLRVAAE